MFCNLFLKHHKGVFDSKKAEKLFKYLTDEANRSYKKEIGEPLSMQDRKTAQKELVREFLGTIRDPRERQYLKDDCRKTYRRREKAFLT